MSIYSFLISITFIFLILFGLGLILQGFLYRHFKKLLNKFDLTIHRVEELTHRHSLTKLPNRTLFFKQFEILMESAKEEDHKIVLLFFDLSAFRSMRDSLGYKITDRLLQGVAKRLLTLKKQYHVIVAHLEADQFIIAIKGYEDHNKIHGIVDKIFNLFKVPFKLGGREIVTGAAIGISIYPDDGTEIESLLKKASIARYQAKQSGTNSYSFYMQDMDAKLMERQLILDHLHLALQNNEFIVFYQPKIDIQTRRIIGAEALLRWKNPALGEVSPVKFIPIAEQSGLIIPMTDFTLKKACAQTKVWLQAGFAPFYMAVNLSPHQFKSADLAQEIANVLWETGLDAKYLELEFTESALMENLDKYALVLRVLNSMGIRTSLDDFGTGSSSLNEIMKLPLNSIKIDQSFIRPLKNIRMDAKEVVFVLTMITMAKQLGLKVIAEGLETEEQLQFLQKAGCDIGQGYLISPPIHPNEFFELLKKLNGNITT